MGNDSWGRTLLALVVVGLFAQGSPAPAEATKARQLASGFSYRLETPSPRFVQLDQGFARIELEGFERHESLLGSPDIPTRIVLVAIPPGAVPRLEVSSPPRKSFHLVRPAPRRKVHSGPPTLPGGLPDTDLDLDRSSSMLHSADLAQYEIEGTYPSRAVRLGRIGVLRDQRYVEVHLAPLRYDGPSGGVIVDSNLEFTVHFDGAPSRVASTRGESRYESVYRRAFVNYEQGRGFRLTSAEASVALQASRARTATTEAVTEGSGTGPRRRIRVRENGLLRLDYAYLQTHAPEFLSEPVAHWMLTSQGVSVPLQIEQIGGDGFDDTLIDRPGEYVQFYGQALDLEPISEFLSDDGGLGDLLYAARDFTDENAYFLTVGDSPQPSITERDAAPGAQPPAGPYFYDTLHQETDEYFWPYAEQDLFYSKPFVNQGAPLRTDAVDLPGLYSTTLPVTFRLHLRGSSECRDVTPDKQTGVYVSNDSAEQLQLPASNPDNIGNVNIGVFDGLNGYTHEFEWLHGGGEPELSDTLQVSLQIFDNTDICLDPPGPIYDSVLQDWIEIDYPRNFAATDDTLHFEWDHGAEVLFEISGFSGPVEVYEITQLLPSSDVYDAVRLTDTQVVPDESGFTARFRMVDDPAFTEGTKRRFVVTATDSVSAPAAADFESDRVSELISDTTQADLVVIAHPDLIDSTCSESLIACDTDSDCAGGAGDRCELDPATELAQLLAWRAGQGISSRLVRMPDIEDEFNHGLPGPLAIRNFIAWLVTGGWEGESPSFVMLVGDSSYDYKGGTDDGTFVPTQLVLKTDDVLAYYSSDNLLAAVLGDDFLPELLVGRISARTKQEAAIVFKKLREYDETPTEGAWRSNALVISDRGKNYDGYEAQAFENMNQEALSWLAGSAYTSQHLRFYSDFCDGGNQPCDVDGIHDAIVDGIKGDLVPGINGAAIAQFVGHGNFDFWSDSVIFCAREGNPHCSQDDTLLLTNDDVPEEGGRLPWLIVHNCLTGGFHGDKPKSMGEQWLKGEFGGSIAVFAPSGLGFRFIGTQVIEEVWGAVFGPRKERNLAVPVLNTLIRLCTENASPETCQYHVLLGDPTLRLGLPHVDAPRSLQAIAGNGEVALSWNPSSTPGIHYVVYRARFYEGPGTLASYTVVADQLQEASFVDTTVVNSLYYAYYVVARNGDGFDSAWSNLNDDCNDDPIGEQCVLAHPLNDIPPVRPEGGETEDTATGGRLLVRWDPNPESDIAYYSVHHGPSPELGQIKVLDWGISTSFHGLENDEPYYFAVTATNRSGVTSEQSEIFSGVPTLVRGVRAPGLVRDLTLSREGQDTLLTWSAVTVDLYGGEVAIGEYEIFRGELADFVPATENRIGATSATQFSDGGTADMAEPNYYYLVRAVDSAGNPGGAGRQLPGGIDDLLVNRSETAGHLLLSWSPVTTDFDQQPTVITHYELYAGDQRFGRAEIEMGEAELVDGAISGNSVEILPASQNRYYSVLAVDVRGNRSPY